VIVGDVEAAMAMREKGERRATGLNDEFYIRLRHRWESGQVE
jgi:hypothetical protein